MDSQTSKLTGGLALSSNVCHGHRLRVAVHHVCCLAAPRLQDTAMSQGCPIQVTADYLEVSLITTASRVPERQQRNLPFSSAMYESIKLTLHNSSPATVRPLSTMSSSTSNSSSSSSVGPTPSTPTTVEDLPSLELGIKYVDSKYDEEKNVWDYEDTTNPDVPAELVQPVGTDTSDENSDWGKFCFIVVRKHSRAQEKHKRTISFEVVIKSSYLRTACRDVMQQVRGVSWVSEPLTVSIAFSRSGSLSHTMRRCSA